GLVEISRSHLELAEPDRQVEAPDSVRLLADDPLHLVRVLLEAAEPMAQRVDVVLSEVLHVAHAKAGCLGSLQGRADRYQLTVREDVTMDEVASEDAGVRV